MIVEHLNISTPTFFLTRTCLEDLLLKIGLYGNLIEMPFKQYSKWISIYSILYAACEYNTSYNMKINVSHESISRDRDGNRTIMECVFKYSRNTSELNSTNRVRFLHGIYSISELICTNRVSLNEAFSKSWQIKIQNSCIWHIKHPVKKSDYTARRKEIKFISSSRYNGIQSRLSSWAITHVTKWLTNWDWFVTELEDFLFF